MWNDKFIPRRYLKNDYAYISQWIKQMPNEQGSFWESFVLFIVFVLLSSQTMSQAVYEEF